MSLNLDRLESVQIVDSGGDELSIDGSGFITANINGTVTVDASDLDIRDLTHVSDTVGIGDGTNLAAVNASLELQVRDDDANTDLDTIAGAVSGSEMQVDIVASLPAGTNNIGDVDVLTMPGIETEDAASAGGEEGMHMLGIRRDADTTPVSADGDFHPFLFNNIGQLKVAGTFSVTEDSYDTIKASVETIGTSAAEITSTPLTNRKSIIIQNLGTSDIYIAEDNTVTVAGATGGVMISKKSNLEFKCSASCDVWAISASAGNDIRVLEMAD